METAKHPEASCPRNGRSGRNSPRARIGTLLLGFRFSTPGLYAAQIRLEITVSPRKVIVLKWANVAQCHNSVYGRVLFCSDFGIVPN